MTFGLSDGVLEKIRGILATFPAVEKAVIYGSRAKGTFKHGIERVGKVLYLKK